MNICGFSKRSGLVKLKEHQMQDKITDFSRTFCQIIQEAIRSGPNRLVFKGKQENWHKKSPLLKDYNIVHVFRPNYSDTTSNSTSML